MKLSGPPDISGRTPTRLRAAAALALLLLASAGSRAAGDDDDEGPWVRVPGRHRLAGPAAVAGPVGESVMLVVALRARNPLGLAARARAVVDPRSRHYQRWLTPRQVGDAFGATAATVDAARRHWERWCRTDRGGDVYEYEFDLYSRPEPTARLFMWVNCAVAAAEAALNTTLVAVQADGGAGFYAPATPPMLPAGVARHVAGVAGLNNLRRLRGRSLSARRPPGAGAAAGAAQASEAPCGEPPVPNPAARAHHLTAARLRRLYSLGDARALNGSGVRVAVATFETIDTCDLSKYAALNELDPVPEPELMDVVLPEGDSTETAVNVELIAAVAPRAQAVVYQRPDNNEAAELLLMNAIANRNSEAVVLATWGHGEEPNDGGDMFATVLQQMTVQARHARCPRAAGMRAAGRGRARARRRPAADAARPPRRAALRRAALRRRAQGQTVIVASGNCGPWGETPDGSCPQPGAPGAARGVGHPQNQPWVTAVGGTTPTLWMSDAWAGEAAWPRSGGGASRSVPRPPWQAPLRGQLDDPAHRSVPDVAAAANPDVWPHEIVRAGDLGLAGGTATSASVWAGFAALVAQCRQQRGLPRIGLLNGPLVRAALAAAALPPDARPLRDVVAGGAGEHAARRGWDPVTGVGSLQGERLLEVLCR
ncbi:sed2 [Scenedesmus sp. PABB004]|nr:sed2 [Scenedesmus sp. PABB004]